MFRVPIIEPLLISAVNGDWIHPYIELLTLNYDIEEDNTIYGNLLKLEIEFESGKKFQIIVKTDAEGMHDLMIDALDDEEILQDYTEMLFVALKENVWKPNNFIPFSDTKYGRNFNEYYDLYDESYKVYLEGDIGLKQDENDWWVS